MTNNNEFIALTEDHIPSNPAETKRIINAGGTVEEGRLNVIKNMKNYRNGNFFTIF